MMRPKDLLFDWMWKHFPQQRIPPAAERLWTFLEYLQTEAKHYNLTAINDMGEMVRRHVLDALLPFTLPECPVAVTQPLKVMDIGSGNGIPGLAAAIAFPDWQVVLLEANHKKCDFLRSAAEQTGTENVEVITGRAEHLAWEPSQRGGYGLALARALAMLPTALELCLPFVALDGWFLAYKGHECEKELEVSRCALDLLGGSIVRVDAYPVEDTTTVHHAVWVKKIAATPDFYPRRNGMPKKRPLWVK